MRSYEDSTHRLGLNRIDILLINDLDRMFFTDEKRLNEKLKELGGASRHWTSCDRVARSSR